MASGGGIREDLLGHNVFDEDYVVALDDAVFGEIETVIEWLRSVGHPPTHKFNPHLMCWSGKHWVMRKQFKVGVIDYQLLIDVKTPELMDLFRVKFGWKA